jgi:hypothetical protein
MKQITGYHFTDLLLRDGRPLPRPNEWLKHKGDVVVCQQGLHASEHPYDALQYAPGKYLHKVVLRGDLESNGIPVDKWAGRERKIIATIDAELLLSDYVLWLYPEVWKEWTKSGGPLSTNVAVALIFAGRNSDQAVAARRLAASVSLSFNHAFRKRVRAKFARAVRAAFAAQTKTAAEVRKPRGCPERTRTSNIHQKRKRAT